MPRRTLALVLPLIAIFAAACGSTASTSPTAAATAAPATAAVSPANAICAAANIKINALAVPPVLAAPLTDPASLPAVATWVDQVAPLAMQEQADLAAASDGAVLTTTFTDLVTKFTAMATAAHGTDVAAFNTAFAAFVTSQKTFFAAATAANLPDCAK